VQRIVEKLREVRERGLSCFGAKAHGFRLNAPIPLAELERFEAARGVTLPTCYRTFLLEAGHGGAGPYYGLYKLDAWDDFATWVLDDAPADLLARVCPLRPGRAPDVPRSSERDLSWYGGTLSLGTQGCAFMTLLIVTGEYRGRVVYVDADGTPPYVGREPDFLAWYERWLDELSGGYETSWFGYGPGGDEEALLARIDRSTADALDEPGLEERAEAARAINRLPRISPHVERRLVELCADPQPAIRASACASVERFAIADAVDAVTACLADSTAVVRAAAVRAALAIDRARFGPKIVELAWTDPDKDVALGAVLALDRADALSREQRLRIVTDTPHGGARSQAAYKVKWEPEDVELLVRLLEAPDPSTRSIAVGGLRTLDARGTVPSILTCLERESVWNVVAGLINALGSLGDASVVPVLIHWCEHGDDFHRLDALKALASIGDDRAVPVARALLAEDRRPERRTQSGSMSNVRTIAELARDALAGAKSPALRALAR
jgi:hypothetical protein